MLKTGLAVLCWWSCSSWWRWCRSLSRASRGYRGDHCSPGVFIMEIIRWTVIWPCIHTTSAQYSPSLPAQPTNNNTCYREERKNAPCNKVCNKQTISKLAITVQCCSLLIVMSISRCWVIVIVIPWYNINKSGVSWGHLTTRIMCGILDRIWI